MGGKKKSKTENTIIIKNGLIEALMNNQAFTAAIKRDFSFKISYWLGRCVNQMEKRYNDFRKQVDIVIEKYAEKEINPKTKKERPRLRPDGQVVWGKNEFLASQALKELREIEVDLGINLIEIKVDDVDAYYKSLSSDNRKNLPTPADMAMLALFFKDAN